MAQSEAFSVMSRFFDYASIYEAKHLEDGDRLARGQEALVTDDVYNDFQQWVLKEMSNDVESPFDKSLDIMKTALEETGYTDALREVEVLKTKLKVLTKEEFKKDQTRIKKRLDLALRSRFVPDSIVTSIALYDDEQVDEAYNLAKDPQKFAGILGKKVKGQEVAGAEGGKDIGVRMVAEAQGAWELFGN